MDSHRRTLFVSFFVCVSLSLCVSCLCPSLFMSLCLSVSEWLCVCVCLCSCLHVFLSVSLTVGRVRRETMCNIEQKLVLARVLSKESCLHLTQLRFRYCFFFFWEEGGGGDTVPPRRFSNSHPPPSHFLLRLLLLPHRLDAPLTLESLASRRHSLTTHSQVIVRPVRA